MKYLKAYRKILESNQFLEIEKEALELGFTCISEYKFQLKFDKDHSLVIHYNQYFITNLISDGLDYIDEIIDPRLNKYLNLSPIARIIAVSKSIINKQKLMEEINNSEEFQDILTNFLDKGYYLVSKKWGFSAGDNIDKRPIKSNFYGEDIYVLHIKTMEDKDTNTIEKEFEVFNHYLKMIGLISKINNDNKTLWIYINKI